MQNATRFYLTPAKATKLFAMFGACAAEGFTKTDTVTCGIAQAELVATTYKPANHWLEDRVWACLTKHHSRPGYMVQGHWQLGLTGNQNDIHNPSELHSHFEELYNKNTAKCRAEIAGK